MFSVSPSPCMGTQLLVFRLASRSLGDNTNGERVKSGLFKGDIVIIRTVQVLDDPHQIHPALQF